MPRSNPISRYQSHHLVPRRFCSTNTNQHPYQVSDVWPSFDQDADNEAILAFIRETEPIVIDPDADTEALLTFLRTTENHEPGDQDNATE